MKKTALKLFALCVFLILASAFICGCQQDIGSPDDTADGSVTNNPEFCINQDNIKDYVIVVPDECSESISATANELRESIKLRFGADLEIKSDFVSENSEHFFESEFEILLGNVDRKQVRECLRTIRENDTGYRIADHKLLIFGGTDKAVKSSVYNWKNKVLANSSDVIMTTDMATVTPGTYKYDTFTLNGENIGSYTIVYASDNRFGEKSIAKKLADGIRADSGYILNCVSDKAEASEYEIRIGSTSRGTADIGDMKSGYSYIAKDQSNVLLAGSSKEAIYSSFCRFLDKIVISGSSAELKAEATEEFKISTLDISLMTYNVRFDNKKTAEMIKLIEELDCDIFGCNEMTDHLSPRIMTEFKNGLSEYDCVQGKAFDKKVKLYDPIFFKKDKFELLESGSYWLSPTPKRESKVPGADEARGCTYAVFKDKATDVKFVYIQTHLENTFWKTDTDGTIAKGARKLQLEALAEVVKQFNSFPVILGGDLNTRKANEFADFFKSTDMVNASTVTKINIGNGTFVNSNGSISAEEKLDYFFVTKNNLSVSSQQAVDQKINAAYPSDHLPLKLEITISK